MNSTTARRGLRPSLVALIVAIPCAMASAQVQKPVQKQVPAKSPVTRAPLPGGPVVVKPALQAQPGQGDCEDGFLWNEIDSTCNPIGDTPGSGGGGGSGGTTTLDPVVITSPPKMPPAPPPTTNPVEGSSPASGGGLKPVIPPEREKRCNSTRDICKQRAERMRDIAIAECDRIESKKPGVWSFILETATRMACKSAAEATCNKYVDGTCEKDRQDCLLTP